MNSKNCEEVISIIIPVYNLEKYIGECLRSIINQDYNNLEIIVVDDGSTDNTRLIVNQWQEKDSRIKLIIQDNSGVSAARNRGIKASIGEFIMFVDGDDWIDEDCVSVLLKNIKENDSDIVKCAFTFTDSINNVSRKRDVPNKTCCGKEAFKEFLCGYGWTSSVWGAIYRSDFIKSKGLLFDCNERVGEDGIFTMKALISADKVTSINKSLYNIRFRFGSASRNKITYSTEHRYVDLIDSSKENKLFRDAFKLRVLFSNLFRTAFQCSYTEFNSLYEKVNQEDCFSQLNQSFVRKYLSIRLNIIGILAKDKRIFFFILKCLTFLGYKPLL